MTYRGPWITPAVRVGSAVPNPPDVPPMYYTGYGGGTWSDVSTGSGGFASNAMITPPDPTYQTLSYGTFPDRYGVGQVAQWFTLDAHDEFFVPVTDGPLPAGAVAAEFEHPRGTILPTTQVTVAALGPGGDIPGATLDIYQLDPATVPEVATPGYVFLTPPRLSALGAALVGTVGILGAVLLPGFTVDATAPIVLFAAPTGQSNAIFPYPLTASSGELATPTLLPAVQYQPPRYRWVYAGRPPLAHRQRRDGAATAGPPLAHMGVTGGARPPLAWRQNTP